MAHEHYPIAYHPVFLPSELYHTAAKSQFQTRYRSRGISISVPCCQSGCRLRSRDICIPVVLPSHFSDLFPYVTVPCLHTHYLTISPSSKGSLPSTHACPATGFCRCFAFQIGKICCHHCNIRNFQFRKSLPRNNYNEFPHSGQNFGGCAGSSGSQPHLSHL